ncbi:hypothetical protein Tco_0614619 [Tanacetum coccineum]
MTRSTVKKLKEPLDEPERELHRRRRAASHQQQNDYLAIAGRNLFENEASSFANSGPKPTPPLKRLREYSYPNSTGFQNLIILPVEQTGNIIDSRDIWIIQGIGEEGPEWVVRSKFEVKLSNFMLEKNLHAKGLGEMLNQHRNGMHEQFSQILETFGKSGTPMPKHDAPTFSIITRHVSYQPTILEAMILNAKGSKVSKGFISHNDELENVAILGSSLARHARTGLPKELP